MSTLSKDEWSAANSYNLKLEMMNAERKYLTDRLFEELRFNERIEWKDLEFFEELATIVTEECYFRYEIFRAISRIKNNI